MKPTRSTETLASAFQALGDPIRLRILSLVGTGSPSATDLNEALGMSQPRVAHHLKILVTAGLISAVRDGRFVRYHAPQDGLERTLFDLAAGAQERGGAEPAPAAKTAPSRRRLEPRDEPAPIEEEPPARSPDMEDFLL